MVVNSRVHKLCSVSFMLSTSGGITGVLLDEVNVSPLMVVV